MSKFLDNLLQGVTKKYKKAEIGTEINPNIKVSITKPQSARYDIDGDIGYTLSEYRKTFGEEPTGAALRNIRESTRTGLYTNKQIDEVEDDVGAISEDSLGEVQVDSTAIDAIDYDPKTKILNVTFVGGDKSYAFPDVPEDKIQEWMDAPSKGEYYHQVIESYAVPGFRG